MRRWTKLFEKVILLRGDMRSRWSRASCFMSQHACKAESSIKPSLLDSDIHGMEDNVNSFTSPIRLGSPPYVIIAMYLVNTHLLVLEKYDCELDVTYCTLSHRLLPAKLEVSFQDIAQLSTCQKQGVTKLRSACRIARSLKLDYIWIDTCCSIQSHHR